MPTRTAGSTSNRFLIVVRDTSSTTGGLLSGLAYNTSGLNAAYWREGDTVWTTVTLVTKTLGTWVTGGFVATGAAGWYEFDAPDVAFASGAEWVQFRFYGAANMLETTYEFEIDLINRQDATRMGLAALPNASAGASGGLPTVDSANGVKVSVGTGTGQINLSSGSTPAAVTSIANDAITSAALASSAVSEIQSGLSTLDAAGVRTALGLASANLDTQLSNINSKTTNLPSDPATATATTAIKAVVDTIATNTQDFPTMITGDGTAGAKFTTTALSNAPGGGGGALTTEQERMFCIIAGMMGFGTAVKTVVNRDTVSQTFTIPNIDLTDSGDEVTITIVKNSSSQQTATASIA